MNTHAADCNIHASRIFSEEAAGASIAQGDTLPAEVHGGRPLNHAFPPELQTITKQVFARFMAIYGNKFKSTFDTQDELRLARREWALSLKGHDPDAIMRTVECCKERFKWMPSIAEFKEILRRMEGDHGLTPLDAAYIEACQHAHQPTRHTWSHAAVYHAGKSVGWFELRTQPDKSTRTAFAEHYQRLCERVRRGEQFAPPSAPKLENRSDSTTARTILDFGKQHKLDEAKVCQMLAYLNYPEGSRMRRTLRRNAEAEAKVLGISELP
jgi:hypothetical protein